MGMYRYSDENGCYEKLDDKWEKKEEDKYEEKKDDKKEDKKEKCCDPESAKALKRILELLDDLNEKDLRLLEEIIERLLCSRSHHKEY